MQSTLILPFKVKVGSQELPLLMTIDRSMHGVISVSTIKVALEKDQMSGLSTCVTTQQYDIQDRTNGYPLRLKVPDSI